jgi:predicted dehydrogenase
MGPAASVQARTRTVAHEGLEVEDLACAMIEFQNGALGVIEGSTAIYPGHSARIEVHGTDGSVVIEDGEIRFWQFKKEKKSDKAIIEGLKKEAALGSGAADPLSQLKCEGHRRQIADFVRAIQTGRKPFVDGREGRRSVELIEAIYRSASTGKTVRLV